MLTKENGEALDPETITRWFRQAVKQSLLPTIRLHDLRHTHATLALQVGIHPNVVSERLGHAAVSITLDTYSHAIPAMQEEAATVIAGLVFTRRWPANGRFHIVTPARSAVVPLGPDRQMRLGGAH